MDMNFEGTLYNVLHSDTQSPRIHNKIYSLYSQIPKVLAHASISSKSKILFMCCQLKKSPILSPKSSKSATD